MDQLKPVILSQVNRWSGSLSRPLLETRAKVLATEAIQSYNPRKGAALATHVTNQLQRLSRLVYTHTQAARLPEHKAVGMASFRVAQEALEDEFGRSPTTPELADHLGWSNRRAEEFDRAFNRRELLTSGEFTPSSFPVADQEDPLIGFVFHDMAPKTQKLFVHVTGYGGSPVLSNPELMKKFKLTQGQLSYQKRKMTELFQNALHGGA
ncbi:MAG: hypothetical protein ACYTEQ_15895 [Planctomycetota bacterium]